MIVVRAELPTDYRSVRRIHQDAFEGPTEAWLVDALRAAPGSISLVATADDTLVGHILFTAMSWVGAPPPPSVAALGPMAVTPLRQRAGIGSALVRRGLEECRRAGYQAVVLIGHPEFYPRFGFRPGRSFGLRCEFEVPDEVFMALELDPGALAAGGTVRYAAPFSEA